MSDYNPIAPKYRPKGEEPPSPEKKWLDAIEEQAVAYALGEQQT